ncbi:PAS-domain containing protein [Neotabrizicola sp. VNH66]|uniref:hybrid sensor histidine kinase/response regulator n=1 Tax=Neotabrizicola sp. VNH66 TaxID=3400918 RepID=UPI003C02B2D7
MTRLSDSLIDPAAPAEANVQKLLTIAEALIRRSEHHEGEARSAWGLFQRAAELEDLVRKRTADLETTLRLLNAANAQAGKARRDLSQAIEAVDEGFALFDEDGLLVLCNSRFCRDLDDVRAVLRPGTTFDDYVGRISRSAHLALPLGMAPEDWVAERMRHHEDGAPFFVELTGDRWLQVSEQPTDEGGVVVLQTDVTGIIRAERSERGKLLDQQARIIRATLDHINQGVAIFGPDLRLVGANRRLGLLLNLPDQRLSAGRSFAALSAALLRQVRFSDGFSAGELWSWVRQKTLRPPLSFELQHLSGIILDVFAQEMPERGFVMSFTDVTRERMAIHSMLRANARLEERVAARTNDLSVALRDAERANATRVRFVAAASHDLLQPLSAAKLFVAAARDDAGASGSTLEKAHNALLSVEAILGALLDISRLESGGTEVDIGPVSLAHLLVQLTDEFQHMAEKKGLRLDILPCRATVMSDATYLRRILQNLISNALRYTVSGRVLVGARRIPGGVRVEVHDTGPGIAPEDQQKIFREFHRVQGTASAAEGMGLGLAIVDRACALLDHPLTLRSTPGLGTMFAVDLPLAPAALMRARPGDGPDPGAEAAADRIALLVENDEDLRRAISLLLERRGVSVLEAETGEAALALLEEIGIVPDVYLIDHQLGEGMTGVETALALKERFGARPVRIVTANRSPEVRRAAERAGLEVLHKPIDPEAIAAFALHAAEA